MNTNFKHIFSVSALLLTVGMVSCTKDLDVTPIDPNYAEPSAELLFNKCYATMATAGNGAADDDSDVDGIDGGTSGYYRQMWNEQQLTTDEAICGWGDEGISGFTYNTYDASHPMLRGFYYRLTTDITFCNQYIEQFGSYDAAWTVGATCHSLLPSVLRSPARLTARKYSSLLRPNCLSWRRTFSMPKQRLPAMPTMVV